MADVERESSLAAIGARGPNEHLIGQPGSRDKIETPALVLDLEAMDANIASMASHARERGVALRPVAKIHKCVQIARRQTAAGGLGVCCATLAEAEVMADGGVPGVLLFAPVVSESKLARLAALNARADGLIAVADSPLGIQRYADAAQRSGRALRVLVDVEVGGGRTGVPEGQVPYLAHLIQDSPSLEYAGVQGYVGTYQNTPDYERRRDMSRIQLEPLRRVLQVLASAGLAPRIVSGGGTGTHDLDTDLALFTELQVGTYVFMDLHYHDTVLRNSEPHPFQPALSVRTTVVSAAKPDYVVTDAGMKEVDATLGAEHPVILRGAPTEALYSLVGDDLGRVDIPGASVLLPPGTVLELLPPHCYQTAAMYTAYHVVRGDVLLDIWPIEALANW